MLQYECVLICFIACSPSLFYEIYFNIISPSHHFQYKLLPVGYVFENSYSFVITPTCATCLTHHILSEIYICSDVK
jgi:hypothetical protein